MRTCYRCLLEKDDNLFAAKNKKTGRLQSICRDCNREYQREHYKANKSVYLAKAHKYDAARRNQRRKQLLDYLSHHPCVDCGESDHVVLQFDHVRGEKRFPISKAILDVSWATLLEEIEKCEVRCANCHFRRTAKQLGWYAYLDEAVV